MEMAQLPLFGLTLPGWLLILSTFAVLIISIVMSVYLAEILEMDDDRGTKLAGALTLALTGER